MFNVMESTLPVCPIFSNFVYVKFIKFKTI